MKTVAIIGSRTTGKPAQDVVFAEVLSLIKSLPKETIIVSGGCNSGADKAARQVCWMLRYQYVEVPAFWYRPDGSLDRCAGPFRNQTIERLCEECYAFFWQKESRGTSHTCSLFERNGKKVFRKVLGNG